MGSFSGTNAVAAANHCSDLLFGLRQQRVLLPSVESVLRIQEEGLLSHLCNEFGCRSFSGTNAVAAANHRSDLLFGLREQKLLLPSVESVLRIQEKGLLSYLLGWLNCRCVFSSTNPCARFGKRNDLLHGLRERLLFPRVESVLRFQKQRFLSHLSACFNTNP